MTTPQTTRWYSVNNMGMATLCADKADAEDVARTCDMEWPRQGQHRAVQLVEASTLDTERAARIAAQQRLADMQELAAKAGLSHMKTVQEAVAEAVAAEREACAELMEQQHTWITNVAASALIRARGTPRHRHKNHASNVTTA